MDAVGSAASGRDDVPEAGAAEKARLAVLGAVPLTRMVDYGMDLGAAQRVTAAVLAGGRFDTAAEREAHALLTIVDGVALPTRRSVRRAGIGALVVAQLAFNTDTPRKRALNAMAASETAGLAAESGERVQVTTVPYAGSALPAVLVRPARVASPPVVVLFGGLSGWSIAYLSSADALAAAGIACLLVELPGQGAARMIGGLVADERITDAVSACIDWVLATDDLGDRVGVWGNSFGGLVAALAAASDDRVAGVCVNGAPSAPTVPPFRTAQEQMCAFFGVDTTAEVGAILPGLSFAGLGRTIDQALLVLHGGADRMVAADDQRGFLRTATGRAEWHEWPDGEHTMYNHATERNARVATWFADVLHSGRPGPPAAGR